MTSSTSATDDAFVRGCTAFCGGVTVASGPLATVAAAAHRALETAATAQVTVVSHATGRAVDLDLRGSEADVVARYAAPSADEGAAAPPRGRGRPRLGVVAREVTLLPQHWDWLAAQPGGASVALRRLVLQAMRERAGPDARRQAQERAYAFMSTVAGDLPGFEDATRALFAGDAAGLARHTAAWPPDVRHLLNRLSEPSGAPVPPAAAPGDSGPPARA